MLTDAEIEAIATRIAEILESRKDEVAELVAEAILNTPLTNYGWPTDEQLNKEVAALRKWVNEKGDRV